MSRGGSQPAASVRAGRRGCPRPDTVPTVIRDCAYVALTIGALLFVPGWLAGLI